MVGLTLNNQYYKFVESYNKFVALKWKLLNSMPLSLTFNNSTDIFSKGKKGGGGGFVIFILHTEDQPLHFANKYL